MTDQEPLLRGFEAQREHLRAVAYRMLGSASDADDAVQEAWIKLSHTPAGGIENIGQELRQRGRTTALAGA